MSQRKNRPENQFRTTTSPLVVRHRINWPISGGPEPQRDQPRIQGASRERASGGSCEASRSPFGVGAVFPRAKRPSPVGWMLISGKRPELYSFLSPLKVTVLLSLLAFHEIILQQTECQSVFHSRKCIDFRQSLPGFRADL